MPASIGPADDDARPPEPRVGRHAHGLHDRQVALADLVRSVAAADLVRPVHAVAPAALAPHAHRFVHSRPLAAALTTAQHERDALQRQVVDARAQAARLETMVDIAVANLLDSRDQAALALAAQASGFSDLQTELELHITVRDKDVLELTAELGALRATVEADATAWSAERQQLRDEVLRLRLTVAQTRTELDAAYAESEVAFAELEDVQLTLEVAAERLEELGVTDWDVDDDPDSDDEAEPPA